MATKLEAFAGRGRGDYQASHDLEDLISVVDGRSELVAEMAAAPDDVRAYVSQRIGELLDAPGFVYSVPAMLGYDLDSQARAPTVLERLARLAGR